MRKTHAAIGILLFVVGFALPALAQPRHTLLASAKVGGLIPVSKLDPHVTVRLGAGYAPPVLGGRLAAIVDLGYSQNDTAATIKDSRVGVSEGGEDAQFSYTMTQRDLNLFVGPQYFILDPARRVVPYAAAGVDLHFLRSVVRGEGGEQPLGTNTEDSTKVGFAVRAGAGYHLGPGLLTGEASFAWAPIDHEITGDSHLGRVAILFGYTALVGW